MNKFVRWYNTNRMKFWVAIFIIILMVAIPRALNSYIKNKRKNGLNSSNENITTINSNKDYSVISGEKIKKEIASENDTIINNFINYCINGDIQGAYNLLSTDCKKKMYPDIQTFINKYYKATFNNKKMYDVQAWYTYNNCYTYRIALTEDILSTGNADASSTEDYYTIVKENGENRLNINGYVTTEVINKSNENNSVKIDILSKDIYIEYEVYNLKVKSKIGKSILLDSIAKTDSMYIQDKDGLKYNAFSHEKIQAELLVSTTKNLDIKFNKKYTTRTKIEKIIFTDIVLDFDQYSKYVDKRAYKNRTSIEIEL